MEITLSAIGFVFVVWLPAAVVWFVMEKKVAELKKQIATKQQRPVSGFSYMMAPDNILIIPMTIKFPDGLTIIHQDGVRETDRLEVLTLTRVGK